MILAVLEKKVGISLLNHDVYVNVVGGMKPDGPGADLAVALAIYSSFRERTSPRRVVALGEVGLTGNLRTVRNADRIVSEAARLGYETIIIPKGNLKGEKPTSSIHVVGADSLDDAIRAYIGKN